MAKQRRGDGDNATGRNVAAPLTCTQAERHLIETSLTWGANEDQEHESRFMLLGAIESVVLERVDPKDLKAYKAAIKACDKANRARQAAHAKLGVKGKALGLLLGDS